MSERRKSCWHISESSAIAPLAVPADQWLRENGLQDVSMNVSESKAAALVLEV